VALGHDKHRRHRHRDALEPILVETTWIICSLAALLLAARLAGRTPATP
jgi:hypothetical protein